MQTACADTQAIKAIRSYEQVHLYEMMICFNNGQSVGLYALGELFELVIL